MSPLLYTAFLTTCILYEKKGWSEYAGFLSLRRVDGHKLNAVSYKTLSLDKSAREFGALKMAFGQAGSKARRVRVGLVCVGARPNIGWNESRLLDKQ